jgi:ankyrin repeat protein
MASEAPTLVHVTAAERRRIEQEQQAVQRVIDEQNAVRNIIRDMMFCQACAAGNLTLVEKSLAEADASLIQTVDPRGFTPLHHASMAGHVELIEFLVKRGCAIDGATRSSTRNTPLHVSACNGQVQSVSTLVSLGANPFVKNAVSACVMFALVVV